MERKKGNAGLKRVLGISVIIFTLSLMRLFHVIPGADKKG